MTFATAVHILFTSFVYPTNVYLSVIHGIKRKPHLSVLWNWYHFVAIANLHQPRPTDSADINTRLQLSDTSSIPPMHGGFLLGYIYSSFYYHHQIGSINLTHCYHIFRGCVPEMFVTSYSVTYCIYIPGKPGFCFQFYCAVYDEFK